MAETIIRTIEPETRVIETWWAANPGTPDVHPHSFSGGGEEAAREYVKKHPGYHLEVIRVWETRITQIVEVSDG